MNVSIIEAGLVSPEHRERHGTYPQMFERLLGQAGMLARVTTVRITTGERLPNPANLEAILITGSSAGVYDDLDWIAPLEHFVREAYAARVPMIGVCFGHQLIAQALGGTVRKSDKGWGIGRHVYDVARSNGVINGGSIAVACSHQDQVVEPPACAKTILWSEFTPHAGLLYANGVTLSVQPHPEFTADYAVTRCEARRGSVSEALIGAAKASLRQPLDHALLGHAIARFLSSSRGFQSIRSVTNQGEA